MIPLRDNVLTRRFPLITVLLILVNTVVFLFEVVIGGDAVAELINQFGFVPARLTSQWMNPLVLFTLITSMYLHAGWSHLIGNMLYLRVFGSSVENDMGEGRFLVFYTLCGVLAALVDTMLAPRSEIPGVGASGAIAGVLGAYLLLYPEARIKMLAPPLWFITFKLRAFVVLLIWFLMQYLNGLASLDVRTQVGGGVAWWAHIGGFLAGMILTPLFFWGKSPTNDLNRQRASYDRRGRDRPGGYG